jgi:hypothetical protein
MVYGRPSEQLTFGVALAFQSCPEWKDGWEPWNWILYAEAAEYSRVFATWFSFPDYVILHLSS